MNLSEIYKRYSAPESGGDKGTAHSYIDIYEEILKPDADFCEIGVWQGHSLAMFQEFFTGYVVGLDVSLSRVKFDVNAKICNATIDWQVAEALQDRKFDYIIDDGSHRVHEQIASLDILWSYLKPGGIYFIEDIVDNDALASLLKHIEKIKIKQHWVWDLRQVKGRSDDILMAMQKVD